MANNLRLPRMNVLFILLNMKSDANDVHHAQTQVPNEARLLLLSKIKKSYLAVIENIAT